MIYVDLKGNLGNQMFIYAFARKIQKETNQRIYLSTYNLKKYFPEYKFSLDEFVLNNNYEIGDKKLPFYMNDNLIISKIFKKILKGKFGRKVHKLYFNLLNKFGKLFWLETEYIKVNFEKLNKYKNIYVNGFWQSPKYFDDIKEILQNEFKSKESILKENEELYEVINSTNSVCLSIRRGDYITNKKITKRYYLCDENYFMRATKEIEKLEKDIVLICFSDDIKWVKENVSFNFPTYYESGKDTVSQKLLLMSSCKNFILSNSSFSWWAQYLANNTKNILAPSKWYYDGSGKDIYQDEWKLISVDKELLNE